VVAEITLYFSIPYGATKHGFFHILFSISGQGMSEWIDQRYSKRVGGALPRLFLRVCSMEHAFCPEAKW
jgi:hypothetical protein